MTTRRELLRTAALAGVAGAAVPFLADGARAADTVAPTGGRPGDPSGSAAPARVPATKRSSTYYTSEKVEAARRNVTDFAWARELRDQAVAAAEPFLAKGDEWLWRLVSGQRVPRSYAVNQTLGSPVTGTDIFEYGNYPWPADPLSRPWKIVDPSVPEDSGQPRVYPTNDFAAYHASGLDEHGVFDPERADRGLLVNELYPELGPTWGVDDGYGWVDDDGNRWTFVAYYHHWHLWYPSTDTAAAAITNALASCRDAYLYTGELRYAHAGLILLDRIADVYPAMDTSVYKREDGFLHSDGLSGRGRIVGCIWETGLVKQFLMAYDAFFPAVADGDDAGIVPFLAEKAEQYGLAAKDSAEAIRSNIETNLVREVPPAIQNAQIRGNFGSHQSTMAMAAVVLDSPEESPGLIDWIFQAGEYIADPPARITGGDMDATLVEDVDRDGFGNEAAPGYNFGWISAIGSVADILEGYPDHPVADLFAHPKYAKMIAARPSLTMLNAYTPQIGDSGSTGNPGLFGGAQEYTADFERYGDPVFAQVAYRVNGDTTDGLYGSVFSSDVEGTRRRIAEIVEQDGPLRLPSRNLTGYGFAALRTGEGERMRGLWTYYGRSAGHGHLDALNLGMHAFGVDLLPDLGYPEFADNNARRHEWTSNTIAHNTVVVDASPQATHWVGEPHGFAATEQVQFFDIAAPGVYPQTEVYRRATALVGVDAENSYVVDFFRVVGGAQHHFSFHAAEGPVTAEGLTLVEQPTGSYAGPDVEPPAADDPPRPDANGFDWLGDVERDTAPEGPFSLDWTITDTWDVHDPDPDLHVRLTMLTDVDEVALCDGVPPRNKPGNPARLRYLVARRGEAGGEPLAGGFVSVIEPYAGARFVREVTMAGVEPLDDEGESLDGPIAQGGGLRPFEGDLEPYEAYAVKVTLTDGRVDYVVGSLRTDVVLRVDGAFLFRGSFGVYRLRDGEPEYAFGHGTSMLGPLARMQGPDAITGTLSDFTRELSDENRLTVALADDLPVEPESLAGAYVYVANDGERNAVYEIVQASVDGATLVLDIGNTTLIRGYVDPENVDQGFRYDVEAGAEIRIPLTREWRRA